MDHTAACGTAPVFLFDKDTAVRRLPPTEYEAAKNSDDGWSYTFAVRITSSWDTPGHHPNGGYLVCILLSALEKVLPHPHPLVLSSWFLSGATAGPAFVKVKPLTESRSRSSAEAVLYQHIKRKPSKDAQHETEVAIERVRVTAMFTDLGKANGITKELGGDKHPRYTLYPQLPPMDQCVKMSHESIPITRSIVGHHDPRTQPGSKGEHCERRLYAQFHDGRQPDVKSLALFADGVLPAVLTLPIPEAWVPTLQYTVYFRAIPAPGPLSVFQQSRHLINGYTEAAYDVLDGSGKLVAQSYQLALVLSAKKAAAL